MTYDLRRRAIFVSVVVVVGLGGFAGVAGAQNPPEEIEYYATDALGSVRIVFTPTGQVLGRSDYLPFGGTLNQSGSLPRQRFTGQERDGEAGLDYFHARSLQARTGRMNVPDPVFGNARTGPQGWNRYAYVGNRPLVLVDPTGRQGWSPSDGLFVDVTVNATFDPVGAVTVRLKTTGADGGEFGSTSGNEREGNGGQGMNDFGSGSAGAGDGQPPGTPSLPNPPGTPGSSKDGAGADRSSPPCGNTGIGFGFGVQLGANLDAGIGVEGASAAVFDLGGAFYDSNTGLSSGHTLGGAAVAFTGTKIAGFPAQTTQPFVYGAFGGGGLGVFVTNARSNQQLAGPATAYSFSLGVGGFSITGQYSTSGNVWALAVGPPKVGPAWGLSVTSVQTTSVAVTHRGCR